jgi:acyl dehydratase
VVLLAEVMEAALAEPELAAIIGTAPRLGIAKFLAPVHPGSRLTVRFELAPNALRFVVLESDRRVASGQFDATARAPSSDASGGTGK